MGKKYISCGFVHHGMEFVFSNEIRLCSQVSHIGGGKIILLKDFDPKKIDVQAIIDKKKEILESFKRGEIYPNCKGCMELREWDYPEKEDPKIKIMILQYWTKCNSHCVYCYTNQDKKLFNTRKSYEFYPILKEFIKRDVIDKNGIVNFSGGEISCLPEFEKVVKLLTKLNYFIIINSSGVKYERTVGDRLKKGNSCLIISVDAGSKEVHERVKQVKTYDKVWKNIKKYAECQVHPYLVNIKYIIVPGYNDTEEEINLWLQKCKEAKVQNVVLGIDVNYFEPNRDNISPHILELFEKTRVKAEEMGLTFLIANRATTMLTKGKYAEEKWNKYRFDEGPYTDIYFNEHRI